MVEKCEMKLARWKSQYLSRGGRLTLVKSGLDFFKSIEQFNGLERGQDIL